MSISHRATVNMPGQGRTIAVVGDVYRFLATGEDTNGKSAMWEASPAAMRRIVAPVIGG